MPLAQDDAEELPSQSAGALRDPGLFVTRHTPPHQLCAGWRGRIKITPWQIASNYPIVGRFPLDFSAPWPATLLSFPFYIILLSPSSVSVRFIRYCPY